MLDPLSDLLWSKVPIVALVGLGLALTTVSSLFRFPYFGGMFGIRFPWGSQQDLGTAFAFAAVAMGLPGLVSLATLALLFKIGPTAMRDCDGQAADGVRQPVSDAGQFSDLRFDRAGRVIEPEVADPAVAAPA